MDYLVSDADIDAKHVAVIGHSRGGKTALWAAAEDERFAMAVSNCSGCTGAKLAQRKKGEDIVGINRVFPHWFCENYKRWNGKDAELPFDQHELIALIAPRLCSIASASEDWGADPEGEFLSAMHASPVYALFGLKGIASQPFPKPGTALLDGAVGYHLREGKHDLNEWNWARHMDFADQHGWKPAAAK
jgi:pimeloyl-ACP methyl ester carboxylesterase